MTWMGGVGYLGITLVLFSKTAFFFGFFLPGDSLLFLAGLLAKQGVFHIIWLIPLCVAVSFFGYVAAYLLGHRLGGWLLRKTDSFWYRRSYLDKTNRFFTHHGHKAILLARMVPVLRSFSGWVAGIVRMPWRAFLFYNFLGSVLWVCLFTLLGYYLGHAFPGLLDYLMMGVVVIILATIGAPIVQTFRRK